jgi:hypothetical protein
MADIITLQFIFIDKWIKTPLQTCDDDIARADAALDVPVDVVSVIGLCFHDDTTTLLSRL